MAKTDSETEAQSLTLSPEEARAWFDKQARELLGISGEEFVRRLDAGEYVDIPDDAGDADIIYLATLASIDRRQPCGDARRIEATNAARVRLAHGRAATRFS